MNAKLCDDARWQVLTCADMCWQVLMVVDGRWRTLSSADTNWECFKITGMYLSGGCDVECHKKIIVVQYLVLPCVCERWRVTGADRVTTADACWRVLTDANGR